MKDLLGRMMTSESGGSIVKHGDMLVDRLKHTQKSRKRGLTDDVRAILEERDAAQDKVRTVQFCAQFYSIDFH